MQKTSIPIRWMLVDCFLFNVPLENYDKYEATLFDIDAFSCLPLLGMRQLTPAFVR
jgi:hypothetical protein